MYEYKNITYFKGITEDFKYIGTQEGVDDLKPFDLFNGLQSGATVSRETLEKKLREVNN